jgi:hypothetical protein
MILNYSQALNQAPDSVGRTLGAAGQMQGLQAQRQNMNFQRQNQEEGQAQRLAQQQQQAQAQQQEQAARQQGAELLQSGTPQEIAQYMFANPSVAKDFIAAADFQDDAAIAARIEYSKGIVTGRSSPKESLEGYIESVKARGGNPQGLIKTLELGTDEAIMEAAQKDLSMLASKDYLDYQKAMGFGQEKSMSEYERQSVDVRKDANELRRMELALKNEANVDRRGKIEEDIKEKKNKIAEQDRLKAEKSDTKVMAAKAVVDTGTDALNLIKKIRNHPGYSSAIGVKGAAQLWGLFDDPIAGTEAAGVRSLIETLDSQAFIAAIGNAKQQGMAGSLSDAEGKKLSASITSLTTAQSEADFTKSLNVIQNILTRQIKNATNQEKRRVKREGPVTPVQKTVIDVTNFNPQQQQAIETARAAGYSEEEIQQSLSKRGF